MNVLANVAYLIGMVAVGWVAVIVAFVRVAKMDTAFLEKTIADAEGDAEADADLEYKMFERGVREF